MNLIQRSSGSVSRYSFRSTVLLRHKVVGVLAISCGLALASCGSGNVDDSMSTAGPVVRALVPLEIAVIDGDLEQLSGQAVQFELAKADRFQACLESGGVSGALLSELVAESMGTIEVLDGDPLSREFVEEYGMGLVIEPPMREVEFGGRRGVSESQVTVREPDLALTIADCEEEAEAEILQETNASGVTHLFEHYRDVVERRSASHATSRRHAEQWGECMMRNGFAGSRGERLRDVSDLVSTLPLERAGRAEAELERQAAVVSYDCSGGRSGIREQMAVRVTIAQEVVDTMPSEDFAAIQSFQSVLVDG